MVARIFNRLNLFFQDMASFKTFILRNRLVLITIIQCHCVLVSYALAYCLRFDFYIPPDYMTTFWKTLPFLLVIRLLAYDYYKLNSGWWSVASMYDLASIAKAVFAGSLFFLVTVFFIFGPQGYPRSIFIIELVLNLTILGGLRFGTRWIKEELTKTVPNHVKRVFILGAGKAGILLLNEIRTNQHMGIQVIGLLDDDPLKKHSYIQNVQVLGTSKDIPKLSEQYDVDEIIVAIPSAGHKKIASIVTAIKEYGIEVRVLPGHK